MASAQNPLLQDFIFPPYDVIEANHVCPALQSLLTKLENDLVELEKTVEPTWPKLVVPLEKIIDRLSVVWGIVNHLSSVKDSPEFRAAIEEIQLRYAGVDLELHSSYVPGGWESIYDIDQKIGKKTHPIPLLPEDRFLCSFSHIFADKYAAGYYSYQWAEVLSADAFSAFEEAGLDNDQSLREMGYKFQETILALGGGKSPNEIYLQFRGREPTPDAFLRYNGLLPTVAA
ncbi:UNVERIFIED_CONTAM: Organellar oligopeptidase A, chloroplastic/mitochondrial [Sesamum radiatum]|uniref:Organellar oligopeptidase A, chloroplastic/mitochondrial n=1 Tax=Sesamum radiatum TaxID=300843 RepID=A0AAW2W519_SESRA